MPIKSFQDIPQFTRTPTYRVNALWQLLEDQIQSYLEQGLEINPDFQRGHVWSEEQSIKYVEFKLSGGTGSNVLYFNHPNWIGNWKGNFVLVDGLQRLTAVRNFLNNKIKAFGLYYKEFEGKLPWEVNFIFAINDLKTKAQVLKWYIEINEGGIVHSKKEMNRVKELLKKEVLS